MHAEKTRDSRGVDGTRRTTAKPSDVSPVETTAPHPAEIVPPDPEVVARPTRRRFTAADKLRILKLADALYGGGQPKEGLINSQSLCGEMRAEGLIAALPSQVACSKM